MSCSYGALYDLGAAADLDDDELDAFARTTGVLALSPYARAWVQDTTARMGPIHRSSAPQVLWSTRSTRPRSLPGFRTPASTRCSRIA